MARQAGTVKLKGTIDDMTYYQMDGVDYARTKSSLDKKRVMKDAAFKNSRKAMGIFGRGSSIAKEVYKLLPPAKKKHGMFGKLTAKASKLLHEGKRDEEVKKILTKEMDK